ncbi:MAG: cold shock domain-containing protein, partial [Ilumatobacteraceae bacterium]
DVHVTGPDPRRLERAVAAPAREQAPPAQVRTTRPAAVAAVGSPDVADVALFTPPTGRQVGTVTFFHGRRGYGFIDGGTGQDVFVHHTNVPTASSLTTGQRVEFAVRAGSKGPEAIDVVLV